MRQGCTVFVQPLLQAGRAVKYAKQQPAGNGQDRQQLEQGLECYGKNHALVLFPGGDMPGTEQDGKQGDHQTKYQSDIFLYGFASQQLGCICDGLDLQGQQWQCTQQQAQGGQGTCCCAVKAESEQVSQ